MNPNSFDQEIKDAQGANPENHDQGTEPENPDTNPTPTAESDVDYRTKFAESSKEALRLLDEKRRLEEENAQLRELAAKGQPTENLYPGFEELDPEAQANLLSYTQTVAQKAKEEIYKDPAISFARTAYNETKWDKAFAAVAAQHPQLAASKEEFKQKYFNANNVPDNIETILGDVAKIFLFDKARDIGAAEERAKQERVDLERATAGERTPRVSRSLEDWQRMAQENPAKFAQLSKEYHADLESGRLKE